MKAESEAKELAEAKRSAVKAPAAMVVLNQETGTIQVRSPIKIRLQPHKLQATTLRRAPMMIPCTFRSEFDR